jgi:hypothetical protein
MNIGLQRCKIWMLMLVIVNITISIIESLGYYELKKHKPWFDKGCLKLLDEETS